MNNKNVEIRDEEMLLAGLSRLVFSQKLIQQIHDLIKSINDWDYFTSLANKHGISSLVFHNLEQLGFLSLLPEITVKSIRNFHMLSISRNTFHKAVLADIVGILSRGGIKVVLIKGLALEMTVYGDAGLRQMTDIDILIYRSDHLKARNLLMAGGYVSRPLKSRFHESIIAWTGKHLPSLIKNGVSVDIHLELFPGKKNKLTQQIIDTSGEIEIDAETAYIPEPRLFFLYLVRHLNFHEMQGESQLRMYADLIILIDKFREAIITPELLSEASEAGLAETLARKFVLLRDFFGISFPAWIDDFIRKWSLHDSLRCFISFLKNPKNKRSLFPGHLYRATIKEIPGIRKKVLFIIGDIFPGTSFMKERYHCRSVWRAMLYYPVRFGKIAFLFIK